MIRLTNDIREHCLRMKQNGLSEEDIITYLMNKLSVQRKQARAYLKFHKEQYFLAIDKEEKQASVTYDDDTGVAESLNPDVKTLDELLAICKVDLTKWEVERKVLNKWASASKDDKGKVTVTPMFQVKAFLKKRKGLDDANMILDFFKKEIACIEPKSFPEMNRAKGKYMMEISIPDLHLGKLAWSEETGYDNYDSKEAVRLYKEAVYDLIKKAPSSNLETILLPIGNDFFNVDNHNSTTTAGTPQCEDSRWQKTFTMGCKLLTEVIEYLSGIANVDVVIVQGNHDYERSFYLGEYISAWFKKSAQVRVHNGPTLRKYIMYGKNLIGFTHGNEEKLGNLPLLMATEAKAEWASTEFREIHLGHLHTEQLKEIQGVKVRHLPSLCGTDAWHSKKGYVGNLRSAQAFLYSEDRGLEAMYYYTIV